MKFEPGKDRHGAIASTKNPLVIAATVIDRDT